MVPAPVKKITSNYQYCLLMGLNLWYPYFDQKWIVENIQIAYYMQQNALDVIGYFVLCYNSFESVLLVPQIGITF